MPYILFFSGVIVSLFLMFSTLSLYSDIQYSLSQNSFVSAEVGEESLQHLRWSDEVFSDPLNAPREFEEVSSKDFLVHDLLVSQQGKPPDLLEQNASSRMMSIEPEFQRSSVELRLFDGNEDVQHLQFLLCHQHCPEVFIEWFQFEKGFSLQKLSEMENIEFDKDLEDGCVDLDGLGIKRCFADSSSSFLPEGLGTFPAVDPFLKSYRLRLDFNKYHYVVRLRTQDRSLISMRADMVTDEGFMPIFGSFMSSEHSVRYGDVLHHAIEQKQWYGGLQPGLEFVHFAKELYTK